MRAAQYVRMSTEHQQYSIENQSAAIQEYARLHGFEIVQSYSDEARSGIDLARRPGLRQLLRDVVSAQANYQAVLVFDVSRWGRFQDTDVLLDLHNISAGKEIPQLVLEGTRRKAAVAVLPGAVQEVSAGFGGRSAPSGRNLG